MILRREGRFTLSADSVRIGDALLMGGFLATVRDVQTVHPCRKRLLFDDESVFVVHRAHMVEVFRAYVVPVTRQAAARPRPPRSGTGPLAPGGQASALGRAGGGSAR
ncbi:hypothetical protein RKE29_14995 [Streptomyces sp. B1866]|uniref:hypothetical protein n=1 Tax=Streptomyces sp. B1866 TaxID=3075431 RepID=UPI00288E8B6A|nr:hypothetical protein [Streptomyces sp. B1866]MDT3397934.1 hypothetical protein [Streptomyces sp. B1866]